MKRNLAWRERFRLDTRAMSRHVWHFGIIFSLFVVMVVYLRYSIASWPDDHGSMNFSIFSVGRVAGSDERLRANSEGKPVAQYRWEWEPSKPVIELTEDERFGEEAFGEVPRRFFPMGITSYLFVLVGAYRTGPNSFGVTGLGTRWLYETTIPEFECSWVPSTSGSKRSSKATKGDGKLIRGREVNGTATQYTDADLKYPYALGWTGYIAVVVHCIFDSPVGTDREGGELKMVAKLDETILHTGLRGVEFVAMVEPPGFYNESVFDPAFQYEYLYCGPPLRGSISPHRAREWIAYHMKLFGESSHFIFYDTGGMDDVLWRVWEPWVKLGRVTIVNAKQEARYHAYLANQVVLADDCLLRAKSLAKWVFFFDIDEYLHVSHGDHLESSFHEVMAEMWQRGRRATTIELEQRPMSPEHCVDVSDPTLHQRQWAIEKLVYGRCVDPSSWFTHWKDVKSMHQSKYVLARGVHHARNVEVPDGMEDWETLTRMNCGDWDCKNCGDWDWDCDCKNGVENKLHYYHYHVTTGRKPNEEVCKVFIDPSNTTIAYDESNYTFDNTMSLLADSVREFEYRMIGEVKI